MTHSQECIARAVQDGLGALADSLQESGEARGDTVRLASEDLMRFIEEFRRLQELEMLAADVANQMHVRDMMEPALEALFNFFHPAKPAAAKEPKSRGSSRR